jgi:uncharacterized membrane protein YphA (DoxX/SURF4 family)
MINPFPTVFLALIAYAVLRVIIGLILIYLGYQHLIPRKASLKAALVSCVPRFLSGYTGFFTMYFGVAEVILGLMYVAGFFTQIAAIITALFALKMLYFRKRLTYPLVPSPIFFLLLIGVSVSLFITGAGVFAFDIPI